MCLLLLLLFLTPVLNSQGMKKLRYAMQKKYKNHYYYYYYFYTPGSKDPRVKN